MKIMRIWRNLLEKTREIPSMYIFLAGFTHLEP